MLVFVSEHSCYHVVEGCFQLREGCVLECHVVEEGRQLLELGRVEPQLAFFVRGEELQEKEVSRRLLTLAGKLVSHFDQICLLYTSPSPRDRQKSRMPSSA